MTDSHDDWRAINPAPPGFYASGGIMRPPPVLERVAIIRNRRVMVDLVIADRFRLPADRTLADRIYAYHEQMIQRALRGELL